MKRTFTNMNGDSDSDDFSNFQSQRARKRRKRKRICVSPLQSQSDNDTVIHDKDNRSNSHKISSLHISIPHKDGNYNAHSHESDASLSLSDGPQIKLKLKRKKEIPSKSNKWTCELCTYDNENRLRKCEMCDNKRPDLNNANANDMDYILQHANGNDEDIETETEMESDSNDILNYFETDDKKLRKHKNKLKKQTSIVDLTQNDKQIKHKNKRKQSKLQFFAKKCKKVTKKTKEQSAKISSITGNRSRLKYYSNKNTKPISNNHTKQKKKKLSKTDSIGSFDINANELFTTKHKNDKKHISNHLECISDDDDCIILDSKNNKKRQKSKQNGTVQPVLTENGINGMKLQSEQWIDKYAPTKISDLYLHSKKLKEIDKYFADSLESNNNDKCILFVVGQSGIGKTSTIKCLCSKYNAKLLCYPSLDSNVKTYNKTVWDSEKTHFQSFKQQYSSFRIGESSQMNKFNAFLNRTIRFGSLNLSTQKCYQRQVILISELPYVGQDEYLKRFRCIVSNICNARFKNKLIIFEITTQFEGTRDDLQIFGSDVLFHASVGIIRFNAINKTLMKKCLNNILTSEKLKKSISNTGVLIDNIIENEKGDLRNAIQTLQIRLVQLLYGGMDKKHKKNRRKKHKKSKIENSAVANIGGREETLSLFHSLGKILYAKKEMEPEVAIEKSDLDCLTFTDLLFENFGDFFVYNQHFMDNTNKVKELDEFGFEIEMECEADNVFDKYVSTLNYFCDADICCSHYNKLKFCDTSTDLRSTINSIQFGSQLYPAIYAASISSRGYLISHDKKPKLKLPYNRNKNKRGGGGLNAIRGSTYKVINKLKNELCASFSDVIVANNANVNHQQTSEHYLKENELALLRSLMCYPTSLYVDIFPLISNIRDASVENECGINSLCLSLIKASNWYSQKYEWKTFQVSRFDYIKKSIMYNRNVIDNNNNAGAEKEEKELIDQIEQFDD